VNLIVCTAKNDYPLNLIGAFQRLVYISLERHNRPSPIAPICGDYHFSVAVVYAIFNCLGAESAKHDRMDRSDPRTSQHGDRRLRTDRHVDDNPVTFLDVVAFQYVGKPDLAHRRSHGWSTPAANHLEKIAGHDPQLKRVVQRASRLIHVDLPLVLHGESGCGKERFAHALHLDGPRAGKLFVTLNCAAIPESLIESELFGYREGAFTGARSKGMQGKVIMAHGGTLFLDEIGDMPLSLQCRLLRVLSEREVLPLGAEIPVKVDVRVICATHRDLLGMVHAGLFREDLYYRLSGVVIYLPAVRNRGDLPELLEEVFDEEIRATGIEASLSRDAKKALESYAWPGNLREMHHVLRYALSLCDDRVILPEHLPEAWSGTTAHTPTDVTTQRARLEALLEENGWRIESAAKALGVARSTLYRQMDRFHIIPPNRAVMGSSFDQTISRERQR
jgi:sigma-54 dependent transcriptional regulator, acetoin dehydrogenase operon transcriptional activator AcoR